MYLPGGPCTRGFVPTTAVVAVPEGLDETAPVSVFLGEVESALPPR